MIILDIEASGVDEVKHSILSIGALDFDHPENQFYGECRVWTGAHIMTEALAVNGFTEEQVNDEKKQTEGDLVKTFMEWTEKIEERTIGGQNPSFDRDFAMRASGRAGLNWTLAFRTIDLHSVAYTHMVKRGIKPPVTNNHSGLNSEAIMTYVGIPVEPHPHNALNGAKQAAEALARLLYNRKLLPEYEKFEMPFK